MERIAPDAARICIGQRLPADKYKIYVEDGYCKADIPVAVLDGRYGELTGLDPLKRSRVCICGDGIELCSYERRLWMDGAVNFRDLGGYRNNDGHSIRWGAVFRSDALHRLSDRDQIRFKNLSIRQVIDLRSRSESAEAPDRIPSGNGVRYVHYPVTHGRIDFVEAMSRIKKGDTGWLTSDFMLNGYIYNIDNHAGIWAKILTSMTEPGGLPVLFHCTGGKDRTGTCAAILLLALGVSEDLVIYDHQLSNIYIAELLPKIAQMIESYGVDPETLFPYLTAPRECIEKVLEHIKKRYNSIENYLIRHAGMKEDKLILLQEKLLS